MSDVDAVQFHLIPVRKWYEKQEMIEDARAYGFAATESLFDDWVEKGLLGPAHREGLGRGRGSEDLSERNKRHDPFPQPPGVAGGKSVLNHPNDTRSLCCAPA